MNKNKTWTEIKADWYFKKEGFQENDKTETMWKKCHTTVLQKQTFLLKLGSR